jgi:hypothetical protein
MSHIGISGFGLLGGSGLVSLIGFSGLTGPNGLVSLDSLVAVIIAAVEFLVAMATQAAAAKIHGVAIKLASANKLPMWHLVLLRCIIVITLSSSKNTRSCHQAGRCYQNYQCGNLVLLCCIIGITLIDFGGKVGCGLSGEYFLLLLDSTQSSKMHYKMQNNYFLPGFHK